MKKLFGLLFTVILSITGFSQINFDNVNQFNLGQPIDGWRLITTTTPASSSNPGAKAFFEFGDGHFTTDQVLGIIHNYETYGDKQTVLTLSTRYDTIKPPRNFARLITNFQVSPTPLPAQQLLNSGENIRITASTPGGIHSDEEMLFIITYKIPPGVNNAKIIFFYNENNLNVFDVLDNTSQVQCDLTGTSGMLPSYPRIRPFYPGTGYWAGNGFTSAAGSIPNMKVTVYGKSLSWDLIGPFDNKEHNIFLSIKTNANLPAKAMGYVESALLYKKSDSIIKKGPLPINYFDSSAVNFLKMSVSANPHDPNFIKVIPHCIEKNATNIPVDYRVHFQNEGIGDAYKLSIDVTINRGLKNVLKNLNDRSFTIDVGKRDYILYKHTPLNDSMFNLLLNFKNPDDKTTNNTGGVSLNGKTVPHPDINPLTQGDIYFSLKVPANKEADFTAQAKIFFYNEDDSSMAPVYTNIDTLHVRDRCSGTLEPGIKPIPDPTPDPCCKKIGPLCWWWWVIIAAILLLIIWLVVRKKKEKEEYRNDQYRR